MPNLDTPMMRNNLLEPDDLQREERALMEHEQVNKLIQALRQIGIPPECNGVE